MRGYKASGIARVFLYRRFSEAFFVLLLEPVYNLLLRPTPNKFTSVHYIRALVVRSLMDAFAIALNIENCSSLPREDTKSIRDLQLGLFI